MKTKSEKLSHFVTHHVTSSVISNGCISSFSCISKHMGKKYHFLAFTFFHKPQVILGFLFLETILRHLCLSYIHPKLCVFFSIYIFFLLLLNLVLPELPYWWFLRYQIHSFFFIYQIYVLEIFWSSSIFKSWKHAYFWLEHFGKNSLKT